MSESTQAILQRAYELIEDNELEQARALLTPLLETDVDNPSLWWVYAHALRERSLGQMALERVLALDPEYPGAAELQADLLTLEAQDDALLSGDAGDDIEALSTSDTDAIDDWEELQASMPVQAEADSSRRGFVALLVILLIIATGAALVAAGVLDLQGWLDRIIATPEPPIIVVTTSTPEPTTDSASPSPQATKADATDAAPEPSPLATKVDDEPDDAGPAPPTQVLDDATPLPALTITEDSPAEITAAPISTDDALLDAAPAATLTNASDGTQMATAVPDAGAELETEDEQEAQAAAPAPAMTPSPTPDIPLSTLETYVILIENGLTESSIDRSLVLTRATELGHTLVLQACAVPGAEYQARMREVMEAVVLVFPDIPFGIDAVAVGLLNCGDPDAKLRIIGASKANIQRYANKEIDAKEFQRTWQPLS